LSLFLFIFQKPDENYLKKEQRDLTQGPVDTRTEPPKLYKKFLSNPYLLILLNINLIFFH